MSEDVQDAREAAAGWVWVAVGGLASLLVPVWLLLTASLIQLDHFAQVGDGLVPEDPGISAWPAAASGAGLGVLFAIPIGLGIGLFAAFSRLAMERRERGERAALDAMTRNDAVLGGPVVTKGKKATSGPPAAAVVLADAPSRILAWLVDRGLLLVACMPLILLNPNVRPLIVADLSQTAQTVSTAVLIGSALLLTGLLLAQLIGLLQSGQSIGKRWFGIRIVRPNGGIPDPFRLLVIRRLVIAVLMGLTALLFFWLVPPLTVVGALLWPTIDGLAWLGAGGRTLHDQWADTLVVKSASP